MAPASRGDPVRMPSRGRVTLTGAGRRRVTAAMALVAGLAPSGCAKSPRDEGPRSANGAPSALVELQEACVPTGPERCGNARDDNCNGIIDEGCGIATGIVQFVIAWDAPLADVDLLVTDPKGDLVEVRRKSSAGLVKDRDCPGKRR